MPDRTGYQLTSSQREHLQMMLSAGALSRETGRCMFDAGMRRVNPGVVGILIDKGFADKRSRRMQPGGSTATYYWLTEGGAVMARQILQGDV